MTIAEGGLCVHISGERQFIISNKQKEKMHEAEQVLLAQTYDVLVELHKKEQQAYTLQRHNFWTKEQGKPKSICEQEERVEKVKKYVNGQRLFGVGHRTKGQNTDGEFDHLLILAHSAESLLESEDDFHQLQNNQSHEDQSYMDNALDSTQKYVEVVAESNASLLQVKTRLTWIRHQARMRNGQVVEEIKGKQTNECACIKDFEGTGKRERLVADQTQIVVDHQNIEAHPGFEQIHYRSKNVCHLKSSNGLNRPSVRHQSEITKEPGELAEQYAACRLNLLKTDKQIEPSAKQFPSTAQGEQVHPLIRDQMGQMSEIGPHLLEQMSERQTNHHSIASQQRLPRASKRRRHLTKHCGVAQIQGLEIPKIHGSIAREQQRTIEQRILQREKPHGALEKDWHLTADGQTNKTYGAEQQCIWHIENAQNGLLHEAKQQSQRHVSDLQRQQHCIAVQQVSKQVEEQLLSQNMHLKQDLHSGMDQRFRLPSIAKFCIDQCIEPQLQEQVYADVEGEKKFSCPRIKIRLSQLKREARLWNVQVEDGTHTK